MLRGNRKKLDLRQYPVAVLGIVGFLRVWLYRPLIHLLIKAATWGIVHNNSVRVLAFSCLLTGHTLLVAVQQHKITDAPRPVLGSPSA